MGAVGRTLIIIVVLVAVVLGGGYFFGPKTASRSQTLEIARPAATVMARLASTPVGATVTEGVTISEAATVDGDTVSAPVAFATGETGQVSYTVTPQGEGSRVRVNLEQDLGANPLDRFQVITGGKVAPLIATAASAVETDLNALPNATFEGLVYVVETVQPQPFFYAESCTPNEPEAITSLIADAKVAIGPIMRQRGLTEAGPLMAVEPRVVDGQYCFQIGYPFRGRAPGNVLGNLIKSGTTPAGQVMRMNYTGTEADVMAQVYDRVDALLGAAHFDNPATREDDWVTYEVYHDDPTQPGGSRNRDIYYVVPANVDLSPVTALAPPAQSLQAAAPAEAPASTTPSTPAVQTPAPATTP